MVTSCGTEVRLTKREVAERLLAMLTDGVKGGDHVMPLQAPIGLDQRADRKAAHDGALAQCVAASASPDCDLRSLCDLVLDRLGVPAGPDLPERFRLLGNRFVFDERAWEVCHYLAAVPLTWIPSSIDVATNVPISSSAGDGAGGSSDTVTGLSSAVEDTPTDEAGNDLSQPADAVKYDQVVARDGRPREERERSRNKAGRGPQVVAPAGNPEPSVRPAIVPLPWRKRDDFVGEAQDAITIFETAFHALIRRDLQKVYGDAWIDRCTKGEVLTRRYTERSEQGGWRIQPDDPLGEAYLVDVKTILTREWTVFSEYFVKFGSADAVGGVFEQILNPVRNGAFHPAGKKFDAKALRTPLTLMAELVRGFCSEAAEEIEVLLQRVHDSLGERRGELQLIDRVMRNGFRLGKRRLLGRDGDLGRLEEFMNSRWDSVALITGSGGVGKTALLETFLDRLLRQPCRPEDKVTPVAVVYVTAKDRFLDYMTQPASEQRFRTLRHLLEVLLTTIWNADFSTQDVAELEEQALEALTGDAVLIALDNLETLEENELDQLERFLSRVRWPAKAIATTRERRMPVNCDIQLRRLSTEDGRELLERELDRLGMPPNDAQWPLLDEIVELVGGVPAFLIHAAHVMADEYLSTAQVVDLFKGEQAFDIQEFAYESSLKRLDATSLRILLFLATSKTPRSRKALLEFVEDNAELTGVLRSLIKKHNLVQTDREGDAPHFLIDNRQLRDFLRRKLPDLLSADEIARVYARAGVSPGQALPPQAVFEVNKLVDATRPLIAGSAVDWYHAVDKLEEGRKKYSNAPMILYWLGRFSWRLEQRRTAIDFYRRAIAMGYDTPDAYAQLALVLWREAIDKPEPERSRLLEESMQEAQRALDVEADHPLAEQMMGQCLVTMVEHGSAVVGRHEVQRLLREAHRYLLASHYDPPISEGDYKHNARSEQNLDRVAALWERVSLPNEPLG